MTLEKVGTLTRIRLPWARQCRALASTPAGARGVTLIEILVAMSVLVIVMLAITAAMGTMQNIWIRIRGKADAYRNTRIALDTMVQRVSQATLDSRWLANTDAATASQLPQVRTSDLHFVSGTATQLLLDSNRYPGHALFFQGPFGEPASDAAKAPMPAYDQLSHMLCGWGYFVEFGSDAAERPDFLNGVQDRFPPRRRFRLWEFRQPAQDLSLFELDGASGTGTSPKPKLAADPISKEQLYSWFTTPLRETDPQRRHVSVVAENILALFAIPFDPAQAESHNEYQIAPDAHFDSRRYQWESGSEASKLTRHRLPPALRLTVIALSEDSWQRLSDGEIESTANRLRSEIGARFSQPAQFEQDMDSLTGALNQMKMGYRVITLNLKMPEQ